MSANTKTILAAHRYTKAIREHKAFKANRQIRKVFPDIGLPNCQTEITLDNSAEKRSAALQLLREIQQQLATRSDKISRFETKKQSENKLVGSQKAKIDRLSVLLRSIESSIRTTPNGFLTEREGRLTINLPSAITTTDGKPVFKAGERLLSVYGKLNTILKDAHLLCLTEVEQLPGFKAFSSLNVPGTKLLVRFSSDGEEGVWDIATMSMRGIQSCQKWGNGNATHVVGSMVDPFTGIIYLTTGERFNKYGSKMIRRCVVRFMVDDKTKNPFLYLERMYPAPDAPTLRAFKQLLTERTDRRFPIRNAEDAIGSAYVPMSRVVRDLSEKDRPYRDSGATYRDDVNDVSAKMRNAFDVRACQVYTTVISEFHAAAFEIPLLDVPKKSQPSFAAMRGDDYRTDYSFYYYRDVIAALKPFFAKFNVSRYQSIDEAMGVAIKRFVRLKLGSKLSAAMLRTSREAAISATFRRIDAKTKKRLVCDTAKRIIAALTVELDRVRETNLDVVPAAPTPAAIPDNIAVYVGLLN